MMIAATMAAMMAATLRRPTATQRRLLRAAALDGAAALEAWREWRRETQVPELEPDSQWLLPALYANLRRAGVAEAALGRYAYVYRHNWYKNHLLLRAAQPVMDALDAHGLHPVLARGAALAVGVYATLGERPIESLVIDVDDANAGVRGSAGRGWQATGREPLELAHAQGWRLRMRARVRDRAGLAEAQTARVAGYAWRVPCERDQLIQVLAGREGWERRSTLFWALDAVYCLRKLGPSSQTSLRQRADAIGAEGAEVEQALALLAEAYDLGDCLESCLT